jgi:hypothetical protein
MAEYLAGYGVEEAKRERIVKRLVVAALLAIFVAGSLFLFWRNYPQKRQINAFLADLGRQDYRGAYRLWGCTPPSPCSDYTFEKFMEDWGPKSGRSISAAKIEKIRSCSSGVIFIVSFSQTDEVDLWVDRGQKNIGFAPWPVCNPEKIPIQK